MAEKFDQIGLSCRARSATAAAIGALACAAAAVAQCPQGWLTPQGYLDNNVRALTVYNGQLIAGGDFLVADNSVHVNHVARWDGASWQPLGSGLGPPLYGTVYALAVYNGDLIAGGA